MISRLKEPQPLISILKPIFQQKPCSQPAQTKLTQTTWNLHAQWEPNTGIPNANYIPLARIGARIGARVGSMGARVGSMRARVGSVGLCFGSYPTRTPNGDPFAFWWNIYFNDSNVQSASQILFCIHTATPVIWERIWEKGPIGNVFTNSIAEKLPFQMLQTILKYS